MCQSSCSVGFSFDHRSLKIGVSNVERIFTCHQLVELWQEVVNLKNEVDRKEAAILFAEEFHTPSHIFFVLRMQVVYKCRMDTLNFQWLSQNW
jgi:3,4-dihydroxy-2-butanone 4-phosphate synthase